MKKSEPGEMVVTDSTVLIYLSKIDRLFLLNDSFDIVLVPDAVYEEVVTEGIEHGYSDALAVRDADFLKREEVEDNEKIEDLRESAKLGIGECEAITLAQQRDAYCLTDDHRARKTADSLGVTVGGTIYVLLESLKQEVLDLEEYEKALTELADTDFRMKASLYRRAIEEAERMDSDKRN